MRWIISCARWRDRRPGEIVGDHRPLLLGQEPGGDRLRSRCQCFEDHHGAVGAGGPAQAATVSGGSSNANVYLVVRDSVCKKSGVKARGIAGTVMTSRHSWTLTHYDMGDNIIYPRVRLNTTNQVILKVQCQKRTIFWRDVSLRDVVVKIKPTKHKQTIWVG